MLSNHVTPRKRKTHLYVIYNFINFGHAYGGFGKVDRRAATILTFSRLLSVVGRLLRNEFQLSATLRPRNVIALESNGSLLMQQIAKSSPTADNTLQNRSLIVGNVLKATNSGLTVGLAP